ncbi:hypothetical protein HELRODRAFT_162253 [Helobdella robusta]|uniref:Uncharacterized protein n=1 Tax=Helobdella robusta TaxID=6412 RepID=T1ESF2_HELRO|nr:hypothetical protein HELRODRAFT_162253 [Helobdella robusta]ESN98793.1 hypothetical protein HELRODRAFT_162253 [Helobdella robusta]
MPVPYVQGREMKDLRSSSAGEPSTTPSAHHSNTSKHHKRGDASSSSRRALLRPPHKKSSKTFNETDENDDDNNAEPPTSCCQNCLKRLRGANPAGERPLVTQVSKPQQNFKVRQPGGSTNVYTKSFPLRCTAYNSCDADRSSSEKANFHQTKSSTTTAQSVRSKEDLNYFPVTTEVCQDENSNNPLIVISIETADDDPLNVAKQRTSVLSCDQNSCSTFLETYDLPNSSQQGSMSQLTSASFTDVPHSATASYDQTCLQ